MPLVVIILMVIGYFVALALLLAYVVVFVSPRFPASRADATDDPGAPAGESRPENDLRDGLPRHDPVDPVCGRSASLSGLHTWPSHGRVYFFCSESCRKRFARNPEAYVSPASPIRKAQPK
jgi:YHS domain-containing protein